MVSLDSFWTLWGLVEPLLYLGKKAGGIDCDDDQAMYQRPSHKAMMYLTAYL